MSSKSLSIVLPCFNEAANISAAIEEAFVWMQSVKQEGQVIVVNDGSQDNSAEVLATLISKYPKLRVITHEVNKGYGAAITTGCDAAETELIAFVDADLQFHIRDLQSLIDQLHKAPFVAGRRLKRADPPIRSLTCGLFHLLVRTTLRFWVRDINCGMKVYENWVWQKIRPQFATGALFNAELFSRLRKHKIPWVQVGVPHYPRKAGQPTGIRPAVVMRMFRELRALQAALKGSN